MTRTSRTSATLVWVNGTFGVGKTTTARSLVSSEPGLRLFDPEQVGLLLQHHLADTESTDFQHWAAWRSLVPAVAHELAAETGQDLVVVQSVLRRPYWDELATGLTTRGHRVLTVLLEADEAVVRDRIERDEVEVGARGWRLRHLADYALARAWMTEVADLVLDTTAMTAAQAASRVGELWRAAAH